MNSIKKGDVKYCARCMRAVHGKEVYCKYCGRLLETPPEGVVPFEPTMMCVYGPPYAVKLYCPVCRAKRKETGLGSPGYYCGKCGTKMIEIG